MATDETTHYSLKALKALRARGKTQRRADAPIREIEPGFWKHARVVTPSPSKASVATDAAPDATADASEE